MCVTDEPEDNVGDGDKKTWWVSIQIPGPPEEFRLETVFGHKFKVVVEGCNILPKDLKLKWVEYSNIPYMEIIEIAATWRLGVPAPPSKHPTESGSDMYNIMPDGMVFKAWEHAIKQGWGTCTVDFFDPPVPKEGLDPRKVGSFEMISDSKTWKVVMIDEPALSMSDEADGVWEEKKTWKMKTRRLGFDIGVSYGESRVCVKAIETLKVAVKPANDTQINYGFEVIVRSERMEGKIGE